jgi:hypothetical protein
VLDKAVTKTMHRLEVTRGATEFAAQTSNIDIDRARFNRRLITPDIREQAIASLHAAGPFHQDGEQF